jgi:hypothetical protein
MNIGLPYFDKHRRRFMSFAFIWTLIAFIITVIGCLTVFNNATVLKIGYWTAGFTYSSILPPKGFDYAAIYIGLQGFVVSSCNATTNATVLYLEEDTNLPHYESSSNIYKDFDCFDSAYSWSDSYDNSWSGSCEEACSAATLTAVTSWVPMIFAMIGALNRMRPASDAPQQKILGCLTDSWGALSLALSLYSFKSGCHETLERHDVVLKESEDFEHEFERVYWWRGGGYWVFWLCFTAGVVRAVLHWLTPCPGCGAGVLTWRLPELNEDNPSYRRVNTMKLNLEEAKNKIKHKASAVEEAIQQTAHEVKESIHSAAHEVKESIHSAAHEVKETVERVSKSRREDNRLHENL